MSGASSALSFLREELAAEVRVLSGQGKYVVARMARLEQELGRPVVDTRVGREYVITSELLTGRVVAQMPVGKARQAAEAEAHLRPWLSSSESDLALMVAAEAVLPEDVYVYVSQYQEQWEEEVPAEWEGKRAVLVDVCEVVSKLFGAGEPTLDPELAGFLGMSEVDVLAGHAYVNWVNRLSVDLSALFPYVGRFLEELREWEASQAVV